MTATLLPNGKQQFFDALGNPLSGGSVAMYVPGTTTPKNTWQDAAQTILNTNPVILNSAGEALIYGVGQYRQIVKDANGNLIWDQLTQDIISFNNYITCTASGTNQITLTPSSVSVTSYSDLQTYTFTAPNTSTGAVTIQVGNLAALPLYNEGGVQAGSVTNAVQDILQGKIYVVTYGASLNGGAGAFQIVGGPATQWTNAPNQLQIIPGAPTDPVLTNFAVNTTTGNAGATRQFAGFIQVWSSQSSVVGSKNGDTVGLFTNVLGDTNSGDIWSLNPCLQMNATFPATGNAQILECDFNNLQGDRGGVSGPGGIGFPFAFGIALSGNSTYYKTAAVMIGGASTHEWHRGVCVAGATDQAAFCDYSDAVTGLDIEGNKVNGIDFLNMSTGNCIRLKNQGNIVARDAANTTDYSIIGVSANNNLVLGQNIPSPILMGNNTTPISDNAYTCGSSVDRWASVWAVNGAIQTSDPSLKTDIATLPGALPIIAKINPVTFKWIDGGSTLEEVEEQQTVQDTISTQYELDYVEIRSDGKAYAVKKLHVREDPAFDEVPVYDDSGKQILDTIPAKAAVVRNGIVLRPAQPEQKVPRTHRIPRMVTKTVKTMKPVSHVGKRTHWGFLATDVKAAFDSMGLDFGGYVKAEDGTQALRPDQLIPVLWKAVQELSAEVSALKAKVGA